MATRERSSISCAISYPCRGRFSSRDRIINSALPFFSSRSGTGDAIYCDAIYYTDGGLSNQNPGWTANGSLFISDRRARRTSKVNHFEPGEPDFTAPFFKISGRVIERVTQ